MTRSSNFILLSFSILQTGESVMSAKGNRTIAIVDGSESYETIKEACGGIFHDTNSMISSGKMTVNSQEVNVDFFSRGGGGGLQVHAWTERCQIKLSMCLVQGTKKGSLEH